MLIWSRSVSIGCVGVVVAEATTTAAVESSTVVSAAAAAATAVAVADTTTAAAAAARSAANCEGNLGLDISCTKCMTIGRGRDLMRAISPLKFSSDTVDPFTLLTASPMDTKP